MSILARIITGFGSSGMLDLSSVLLNDIGGPFGVAVLRSYFMTVTMIGFSAGGALGGFWRHWSFLLHVPIVFLCALVTVRQLPKDTPQDPQSAVLDDNQDRQEEKIPGPGNMDIIGMIILVCAIVSALMMVQVLQGPIIPESKFYISAGLGLASLLLVGVFCVHEVRWAKRPLIPLSFMMSSQTGIIVSTVSEYFVRTKGFSMAAASACLAPPALGGALGGYLAGRQIQSLVAPVSIQCLSTHIYNHEN
ncbi:hypothetical protein N7451_008170 [Penicillium sp. IBT 35674x]|nr:hypothetical protein N7451_008170 [Penicillium sp. IBT 35674x]